MIPTPGLAFLTDDYGADIGVMISASHNPMPDNGIKFFSAGGRNCRTLLRTRLSRRWKTWRKAAQPVPGLVA